MTASSMFLPPDWTTLKEKTGHLDVSTLKTKTIFFFFLVVLGQVALSSWPSYS
jgi:hypothetical protein